MDDFNTALNTLQQLYAAISNGRKKGFFAQWQQGSFNMLSSPWLKKTASFLRWSSLEKKCEQAAAFAKMKERMDSSRLLTLAFEALSELSSVERDVVFGIIIQLVGGSAEHLIEQMFGQNSDRAAFYHFLKEHLNPKVMTQFLPVRDDALRKKLTEKMAWVISSNFHYEHPEKQKQFANLLDAWVKSGLGWDFCKKLLSQDSWNEERYREEVCNTLVASLKRDEIRKEMKAVMAPVETSSNSEDLDKSTKNDAQHSSEEQENLEKQFQHLDAKNHPEVASKSLLAELMVTLLSLSYGNKDPEVLSDSKLFVNKVLEWLIEGNENANQHLQQLLEVMLDPANLWHQKKLDQPVLELLSKIDVEALQQAVLSNPALEQDLVEMKERLTSAKSDDSQKPLLALSDKASCQCPESVYDVVESYTQSAVAWVFNQVESITPFLSAITNSIVGTMKDPAKEYLDPQRTVEEYSNPQRTVQATSRPIALSSPLNQEADLKKMNNQHQ